jgi:hypothetical protein
LVDTADALDGIARVNEVTKRYIRKGYRKTKAEAEKA